MQCMYHIHSHHPPPVYPRRTQPQLYPFHIFIFPIFVLQNLESPINAVHTGAGIGPYYGAQTTHKRPHS